MIQKVGLLHFCSCILNTNRDFRNFPSIASTATFSVQIFLPFNNPTLFLNSGLTSFKSIEVWLLCFKVSPNVRAYSTLDYLFYDWMEAILIKFSDVKNNPCAARVYKINLKKNYPAFCGVKQSRRMKKKKREKLQTIHMAFKCDLGPVWVPGPILWRAQVVFNWEHMKTCKRINIWSSHFEFCIMTWS